MITKDGRDTPLDKLTPELYIVPRGEEKAYHCVIEVVQYDPKTGKKLSKPRLQKFGKKSFDTIIKKSLLKQGYTITILHDPTEWLKAKKAELTEKAQNKAKAEQEKFNKAVDAAVAEKLDAAVAAAVAKALAEAQKKAEEKPAEQPEGEQQGETQPEAEKPAETKKAGRPKKDAE